MKIANKFEMADLQSAVDISERDIKARVKRDIPLKQLPPGIPNKFVLVKMPTPVARAERFSKAGDNANHPLTIEMREIKTRLDITTNEMCRAINKFEKVNGRPADVTGESISAATLTLKPVLLSSYLQGSVVQDTYVKAMHSRIVAFSKSADAAKIPKKPAPIKILMDGWFAKLGIDVDDAAVSPHRELARQISHLCKRAVLIDRRGIFKVGGSFSEDLGWYSISMKKSDELHKYLYRKADKLLIEDSAAVEPGDIVQYSKGIVSGDSEYAVSQDSPINQTTFYRWYRSDKMPRSKVAIDLIQNAVDEAADQTAS